MLVCACVRVRVRLLCFSINLLFYLIVPAFKQVAGGEKNRQKTKQNNKTVGLQALLYKGRTDFNYQQVSKNRRTLDG